MDCYSFGWSFRYDVYAHRQHGGIPARGDSAPGRWNHVAYQGRELARSNRMFIGSEGILGIITEAWVRLQDKQVYRASAAVQFPSFEQGVTAVASSAKLDSTQPTVGY